MISMDEDATPLSGPSKFLKTCLRQELASPSPPRRNSFFSAAEKENLQRIPFSSSGTLSPFGCFATRWQPPSRISCKSSELGQPKLPSRKITTIVTRPIKRAFSCEHEFLHLHGSNDNPSGYLEGSSEGQRTSVELRVCIGGTIYIYRIISNMKVKTYKEKGTLLLNTNKATGNSPGYLLLREIT